MNRKISLLPISIFVLFLFVVFGCGGAQNSDTGDGISSSADGSTETGNPGGGSTETGNPVMAGLIQKGPFYKGTKVVVRELDDVNLMPTGIEHTTEVTNNLGEFTFDSTTYISSTYVEISATGYYYDEISAIESTQSLTLSAFVDITKAKDININILTTIAAKREKHLITQAGKTYEEAKIQAQQEVMTAFKFSEGETDVPIVEDIDTFIRMNIGQNGTKNAVLLSLSILLQDFQDRCMLGSVSQAIDIISTDIETDGVCDKPEYIDLLFSGADKIDLVKVRTNLETYFRALSKWFVIPDFESIFENNIIPKIRMSAPIFSVHSGTYNQDLSVAIYSPTKGAIIYYSINGSDPIVYQDPIEISGNGSVVSITAWSTIYRMWQSRKVTSYYIVDYDYEDDFSKYKMDMTIDDYQSSITGTWIGYIESSAQWLSPDNVMIIFDEEGKYTAERLSFFIHSLIPIVDILVSPAYEQLGSNLCYGTEYNFGIKSINFNFLSDDGKAVADLILDNIYGETKNAGTLLDIAMSDDFNHLQYKFQCGGFIDETFTFYLTRLTE